jgi:hypothetical protein
MTKPLTKLDQHVKRAMLQYPTLYKTRTEVLVHLYLVLGNGYDWIKGELRDKYEEKRPLAMRYDDLEEGYLEERFGTLEQRYLDGDAEIDPETVEALRKMDAERREELRTRNEAERAQRRAREEHIDVLCQSSPGFEPLRSGHYESPNSIIDLTNSGYLFARFPSVVEKSFRDGAVEVLNAVLMTEAGTDAEMKLIQVLRARIKNGERVGKLEQITVVKEQTGWDAFKAAKNAMTRRGFKAKSDASNGCGIVTHFTPGPLNATAMKSLVAYMAKNWFSQTDSLTWERALNVEGGGCHHVKLNLVAEGDLYRPRLLIITHPDDGEWVTKTLNYYENGHK